MKRSAVGGTPPSQALLRTAPGRHACCSAKKPPCGSRGSLMGRPPLVLCNAASAVPPQSLSLWALGDLERSL